MSPCFLKYAQAAWQRFSDRGNAQIRTLHHLHAKVVVIDGMITYCGSANWYWYSLQEAAEIVLRGDAQDIPTLLDELASLWGQATIQNVELPPSPTLFSTAASGGYKEEVVDPIAAAKMAEVQGSFVLRHKPPRNR
jgi:hypothetical protein